MNMSEGKKWLRNTDKVELKIGLEAYTRCAGSCGGCILTEAERRSTDFWSPDRWKSAASLVQRFITAQKSRYRQIDEIALNLGQGDYFTLDNDRIDFLVKWMWEAAGGEAASFVTASAVTNPQRLRQAADRFYAQAKRYQQALLVDVVFDPKKVDLDSFSRTYEKNIQYLRDTFGNINLVVNLGPDTVSQLSPEMLHNIMAASRFSIVTINLTPTVLNGVTFAGAWPQIIAWLRAVLAGMPADNSYEINFSPVIARHMEYETQSLAGEHLADQLKPIISDMSREIYIDNQGYLYLTQAGFGDVPLTERFGYAPIASIDAMPDGSLADLLEARATVLGRGLLKQFMTQASCSQCPYLWPCLRSGVGVLRQVMDPHVSSPDCPIGVRSIMADIDEMMRTGRDHMAKCYDKQAPYVQREFESPRMPKVTPAPPSAGVVLRNPD